MIRANRLATNRLLAKSLAGCNHKPRVLICASGIGHYPSSGDTVLTENSPAGTKFYASVQQDAEAATAPASEAGIRVVLLRIPAVMGGPVLQRAGFQAGNGQQWMSWVGRDELASIIEFALNTEALTGPVNAISPNPLRNAEFATTAVKALEPKSGGSMPAFLVRLVLGEVGIESGVSTVNIIIPEGVNAQVTYDGGLSTVNKDDGWNQNGEVYTLSGSGPTIIITIKMGVGTLNLKTG